MRMENLIYLMEVTKIQSKLVQFFLEKIAAKLDYHRLKKFVDFGFILIEKTIVNFDKLHFIYYDIYNDMIANEITLADISKDDKVLHIGCGPIPATSILLTKKSGTQVIGIDKDPRSVNQAHKCVLKSGVSKKVQIKHADAKIFPVDKFDIIILSQGIKEYKEVLEHIARSIKYNTRVIFRTSSLPGGEISQNDLFIKDLFNINKVVAQKKNALLISIMLSKGKE